MTQTSSPFLQPDTRWQLVRRHHALLRSTALVSQLGADEPEADAPAPMALTEETRDLWLGCLWQTLEDMELSDRQREQFWNWLEPLSAGMLAGAPGLDPRRYPFNWVRRRMRTPALGMCRR